MLCLVCNCFKQDQGCSTGSDVAEASEPRPAKRSKLEVANMDDPLVKLTDLRHGDVFARR